MLLLLLIYLSVTQLHSKEVTLKTTFNFKIRRAAHQTLCAQIQMLQTSKNRKKVRKGKLVRRQTLYHIILLYHILTLAPVHVFFFKFFYFYKLRLLLQNTQHAGGNFTGPGSVHRDQILPRWAYNSIFRCYRHRRRNRRARDVTVSSEFPLYKPDSSPLLERKRERRGLFIGAPGGKT